MTLDESMRALEGMGSDAVRKRNARHGAGPNQFGAKLGDIRKLANTIKTNHALALALWKTENLDARLLATLIAQPKRLGADELDGMVRQATFPPLADWLNAYVVKKHPEKEPLRLKWLADRDPMAARSGWSLTAERIEKSPDGLDLPALLDRIEAEMGKAPAAAQWTMNVALAMIGIHHPGLHPRAIAIGEKLGVYRDYPVSKGCTSPFAPVWIAEMVRRQA